jgi:hypothetical protein
VKLLACKLLIQTILRLQKLKKLKRLQKRDETHSCAFTDWPHSLANRFGGSISKKGNHIYHLLAAMCVDLIHHLHDVPQMVKDVQRMGAKF